MYYVLYMQYYVLYMRKTETLLRILLKERKIK